MMSKSRRIKYIASFDIDANKAENRVNMLSSANKINYIITVLNQLGYGVDVISFSRTLNKKCYAGKRILWGTDNSIKLFPTTWNGGVLLKILNHIILNTSLFFYILTNVRCKDTVIMYHSYGILWLNVLFMLKGVHLIEECEEIYGDIFGKKWMSALEHKLLTKADSYIYPTELLNSIVNVKNKPYLVVHGSYKDVGSQFFSDCKEEPVYFDPNLYHVAYTGILDPRKGCIDVVKSAEFLDETYHIHILGFGSAGEIDLINQTIRELVSKTKCKVSFDGLRKGQEYTNYLSYLNLGVCTLDTDQHFINTQFPSKIISYMAAGVPVLCSEAKAIRTCEVSSAITFYKGNSPKDIAEGIKKARENDVIDTRQLLDDCDLKFKTELNRLINYDDKV